MDIPIIGIDCATQPRRVGLALGRCTDQGLIIEDVRQGGPGDAVPLAVAVDWAKKEKTRVLFALDAPLGWPVKLSSELTSHEAGDEINACANVMFRRETDRQIRARLGKNPLAVGADRIAHTALAALRLIGGLRRELKADLPLAWTPEIHKLSVVEVYPAATRRAHGMKDKCTNAELARELHEFVKVIPPEGLWGDNRDMLDSMFCVLAGYEFLTRKAIGPNAAQEAVAKQEGWIWCS